MSTPMGSVGTFVGDGTANFAGNGGMVTAGVGQVGFAGQGIGFNQGFGTGQINGVGIVNVGPNMGRGLFDDTPYTHDGPTMGRDGRGTLGGWSIFGYTHDGEEEEGRSTETE